MLDLETQIHRYVEAVGDRVPVVEPRLRRTVPRWAWSAVAAAIVVVAVVGGLLVASRDDQSAPVVPATTVPLPEPGEWGTIPEAPLAQRENPAAVVTDDELVVWGGRGSEDTEEPGFSDPVSFDDGAAYSFTEGTWRPLAESPLAARSGVTAVWTGEEVVFVGGEAQLPDGSYRTVDGAGAYDPATDTWRTFALPPNVIVNTRTGVAWTGEEIVLSGVTSPPNAFLPTDTYAIDPATGEGRPLDPVPTPIFSDGWRTAVWAGDEVLVATQSDGQREVVVDRLDPASGTWAVSIPTGVPGFLAGATDLWTGEELLIVANLVPGARVDPDSGAVRRLPAKMSAGFLGMVVLEDGVFTDGTRWWDPADERWRNIRPAPPGPFREFAAALTYRGRYVVWGGSTCGPAANCIGVMAATDGLVWTPPG
jgi:hypothetical protein